MPSASREVPLWEKEECVEARAEPAFAFRYWTDVANMAADPGIDRVETDGPYRPGMQATTHLKEEARPNGWSPRWNLIAAS